MVSHFRPLLLPARARGTHFLLPLGSVILQLGVPQATVKAGWPAAFPRLATAKGSRWAVAAVSFVARSSPEPGRFAFPAPAVCRRSIGLVAVDLAIAAADPFCLADLAAVVADSAAAAAAAADPVDPAVAADPASGLAVAVSVDSVATVSAAADLDFFAVSVCPFAAATEKGRAAVAISCFLAPRFSF